MSAFTTGKTINQQNTNASKTPSNQRKSLRVPFGPTALKPASLSPITTRAASQDIQQPSTTSTEPASSNRSHETDYVVIGSGIGGLSCAALLARYGYSVTVCEAHYHAGGAAHGFEVQGFDFDAGPSFFAGLSGAKGVSSNPLKQVLDAVDESVECVTYNNVRDIQIYNRESKEDYFVFFFYIGFFSIVILLLYPLFLLCSGLYIHRKAHSLAYVTPRHMPRIF